MINPSERADLIPCPHCGAEAVKGSKTVSNFHFCPAVKTGNCTNFTIYPSREAWQNQPTPPRVAELERKLEVANREIEALKDDVAERLREDGYDGLGNGDCCCLIGDESFMGCRMGGDGCEGGYRGPFPDGEDGIYPTKEACEAAKAQLKGGDV